jgi:aminoglycoside phosphotransferase (APT) family kinase protein
VSSTRMHDEEVAIDVALVRRLINSQFPRWANLRLRWVASAGTDNVLVRLGDDMVVRLPRIAAATQQAVKEHLWLPRLAPLLPLPIPMPLALGTPGEGYPWQWSVRRWLPGQAAVGDPRGDPIRSARALAEFIAALQRITPGAGPPPGEHNFHRGDPLASRDDPTREAIAALDGLVDTGAVTRAWDQAVQAPTWDGPPRWIHGDLHGGNLLLDRGTVSAVIDFGGLAVADPACDLMVAWTYLPGGARGVFRTGVTADDASWARGRGWALSMALIALPYYLDRNPSFAAQARRWLGEVLADR